MVEHYIVSRMHGETLTISYGMEKLETAFPKTGLRPKIPRIRAVLIVRLKRLI